MVRVLRRVSDFAMLCKAESTFSLWRLQVRFSDGLLVEASRVSSYVEREITSHSQEYWSSCSSMQIHSSIPSFGGVSVEWVFSCYTITIVCSFVRLDLGFFSSSFLTTIQPSTTCSRLHDPYLSEILPNDSRLTALDWGMITAYLRQLTWSILYSDAFPLWIKKNMIWPICYDVCWHLRDLPSFLRVDEVCNDY